MFGNKKLQKEKQELANRNHRLEYELDRIQKELNEIKDSRSKWREKAHDYRRQRTHLVRQLQTQEKVQS